MAKSLEELTVDDFIVYEKVRQKGDFNMFDADKGCAASGLDKDTYLSVINNYTKLKAYVKNYEKLKARYSI